MIAHKLVLSAVAIMFPCWNIAGAGESVQLPWLGEGPTNTAWHDRLPEVHIVEMGREAVWDLLEQTSRVVRCGSQGISICDGWAGTCTETVRTFTFVHTNVTVVDVFINALGAMGGGVVFVNNKAVVGCDMVKIFEVRRKGICIDKQSGRDLVNVHVEFVDPPSVGFVNADPQTGVIDLYHETWVPCISIAPRVVVFGEKAFRQTVKLRAVKDGYVSVTNEVELFPAGPGSAMCIGMEKKPQRLPAELP